jgi:hypothetical protein
MCHVDASQSEMLATSWVVHVHAPEINKIK